jgi:hypothetical protein
LNSIKILSPSVEPALPLNSRGSEMASLFQRGEIVDGFVLGRIDPHHLILRIQGEEFRAETQTPLPMGTKVALQVEEVAPRIVLRPVPQEEATGPEILSLIKRSLPLDLPLDQLANRITPLLSLAEGKMPARIQETVHLLLNLIHRFSLSAQSNPETIRELILGSGLFWENRLKGAVGEGKTGELKDLVRGDIKGILSALKQELDRSSFAETGAIGNRQQREDLLKGVDSFLRKIELYQLLNVNSPEENQRFHLLLPLMFGRDFCFGELCLSLPPGGTGDSSKEESWLTFLLNWAEGGRIRIDIKIREEQVVGQFQTDDPRWKGLLQEGMGELTAQLRSMGLRPLLQVAADPLDSGEKTIAEGLDGKIPDLLSILV